MVERKRWGVGSNQYQKRRGQGREAPPHPDRLFLDTPALKRMDSGRVEWDRTQVDFDLISRSETTRALVRFEKVLPEFIWNAAALEGNTYTLPQVQTLLDGVSVGGKRLEEADQIIAMSEGLNEMTVRVRDGSFDLSKETSNQIHALVARHEAIESGGFRGEGMVSGGGAVRLADGGAVDGDPIGADRRQLVTDYQNLMAALDQITDPRERALGYFCSATRSQFYFDGNKRTARIMMSGELMRHGYESISVPYARQLEFNQALDTMFRTDDATDLMSFLTTCTTPSRADDA